MTVIAVKVNKDKIEIASDSVTTRGYTQQVNNHNFSKLFVVDNIIVGSTGLVEEAVLLQLFLSTTKPADSSESAMLAFLDSFYKWMFEKVNRYEPYNQYIIIVGKVPYFVHGYSFSEVTTYEAIGAGQDYALSAMYLGHGVEKAVETAIELNVYCEYPIQYYEVKKDE